MNHKEPLPPHILPLMYYTPEKTAENLKQWIKHSQDWIGIGSIIVMGEFPVTWNGVLYLIDSYIEILNEFKDLSDNATTAIQYLKNLGEECRRAKKYYEH